MSTVYTVHFGFNECHIFKTLKLPFIPRRGDHIDWHFFNDEELYKLYEHEIDFGVKGVWIVYYVEYFLKGNEYQFNVVVGLSGNYDLELNVV